MISVVDMDDALVDLHTAFIAHATEKLGIQFDVEKHDEFSFYRKYGISDQEFLDLVQEPGVISRIQAFPTSAKALSLLKQTGTTINIVTARGYMENAYNATSAILEACHLSYDNLHIVPEGKKKSDIYKQFSRPIDIMIDDAVHNISDALESKRVRNIFLLTRNWNKQFQHSAVHRKSCVLEAVHTFRNILSKKQHPNIEFN